MKILIACEESQAVCKDFRKRGHEAFSCDIQPCSGGHPEWHIQDDVLKILHPHYLCECGCRFEYGLGKYGCPNCCGDYVAEFIEWDMIIAFPPCTFLTVSGNKWFDRIYNLQPDLFDGMITRHDKREKAISFFMEFTKLKCKWAIENPIGIMSTQYRKPDQIIQPWQFGDGVSKATCLWLNDLPKLKPTNIVKGREWHTWNMFPCKDRKKLRSKTFPGIAQAMAKQWSNT